MKTFRKVLGILGVVALLWGISASVAEAAPANNKKAVAKKKQADAKTRAKAAKSNAEKKTQTRQASTKRTATPAPTVKEEEVETDIKKRTVEGDVEVFVDTAQGRVLYKSCAVCHGDDGKKSAPGQVEGRTILTRGYEELIRELVAYRDGTANNGGLDSIMTANMEGWSDEDIVEVSKYVMELISKYGGDVPKTKQTSRR